MKHVHYKTKQRISNSAYPAQYTFERLNKDSKQQNKSTTE